MERDVSASLFQRGDVVVAAAADSRYFGRQSSSCCEATVCSSGNDQPEIFPVGGSTTSLPTTPSNVNALQQSSCRRNASQSSCQRVGRDQHDEPFRGVAPAPAPPTAPPKSTAAASTEAVTGADIPENLNACKGKKRAVSRAAVEAWAAAETWASTLAVATGAVVSGGRQVAAATDNVEGMHSGVFEEVVEPGRQRCDDADVVDGPGMGGCLCFSWSGNCCASGRVCQRRTAVQRHDRMHRGSSPRREVAHGSCHHPVGGSLSTFPRDAPSRVLSHALLAESSFDEYRGASVDGGVSRPRGLHGAAAAIVLWRIDRGEQCWRRQAMRVGLVAFRAHCLQASRGKQRDATAMKHWEKARKMRGFRRMETVVRREDQRREAANAVAAADVLARARRIRKVLVMLRR